MNRDLLRGVIIGTALSVPIWIVITYLIFHL